MRSRGAHDPAIGLSGDASPAAESDADEARAGLDAMAGRALDVGCSDPATRRNEAAPQAVVECDSVRLQTDGRTERARLRREHHTLRVPLEDGGLESGRSGGAAQRGKAC